MIFNTFQFIWLFPIIFVVYWLTSRIFHRSTGIVNILLLVISYGLYMQWNAASALALLGVTVATYIGALVMQRRRKAGLVWGWSLLALLPLLIFKYYNFITQAGASVLAWMGIDTPLPGLNWVVPLGLSFYSLQAVGYMLDVYNGKVKAERSWWTYMLFVSFFPQILCGPISRASELMPQLKRLRPFDYARAVRGCRYLLWGMFLKVVVADRLGIYVDTIFATPEMYSGESCLAAAIFFSLQIYGDFAGYSFMALGVAALLGIELVKNFNTPYLAGTVTTFWHRWNISLTRWLTDHIYIPLGGSRRGRFRTYLNIMVTFLVSGLWHGANWTFIFWGALHGCYLCVEKWADLAKRPSNGGLLAFRILLTFGLVTLAWIFFRSPTIEYGSDFIARIFTVPGSLYYDESIFAHLIVALTVMLTVEMIYEFRPRVFHTLMTRRRVLRWAGYLSITIMILLFGVLDAGQFIYVRF